MKKITFPILFILLFSGCATNRAYIPRLQESSREGLILKSPVLISIFDGRADKTKSGELTASLKNGLNSAYGKSIQWVDYFDSPREGSVLVKLRIKKMDADFGCRFVVASMVATQYSNAKVAATNGWGPVVASVNAQQNLFGGAFSSEGWWVGTSWIDVEITDARKVTPINFIVPLVAEHNESNLWGYKSAEQANKRAWEKISPQLIQLIDNILIKVRDDEK